MSQIGYRLQSFLELKNHLCSCVGVPVILKSQFDSLDEDSQFFPAIIIVPGPSERKNLDKSYLASCSPCTKMTQKLFFGVAVSCSTNTRNQIDVGLDNLSIEGALVCADDLEKKLYNCLKDLWCNETLNIKLNLLAQGEIIENNSHLILPSVFEREIFLN